MTHETSPWEDPDRVDEISGLVDKGDMPRLADALMGCHWPEGVGVNAVLRAMPYERRLGLAHELVERHNVPASVPDQRHRAMVLLAVVADGFAAKGWCDIWVAMLEGWAQRNYWFGTDDAPGFVAAAVLSSGRGLSGEVVGLLRRSALQGVPSAEMLLSRLSEPVLNPGELWSDRILAELPGLGQAWRDLGGHLLTAKPGQPTGRWDRTAAGLVDVIGADTVRRTATPWLALATHGGGDPDGGYDPYNVHAIRGLAWLLSLLPPHPETVRVLGALVERPPVRTGVAGAGVQALARLEGGAGRAELARLAERVEHKVTLKQIRRVLAA